MEIDKVEIRERCHGTCHEAFNVIEELQSRVWELEQWHNGHLPTCAGMDPERNQCGCGYLQGTAYRELANRARELEEITRWRDIPAEMPSDDTQILIEDINGLTYVVSYNQEDDWLEKNAKRWLPIKEKKLIDTVPKE